MEASLDREILAEGAAIHRGIREWRAQWAAELQQFDGSSEGSDGLQPTPCSRRFPSPLHAYYPFLFHTCFPEIPVETVRDLALADRLYTEHLLTYDRTLDGQKPIEAVALFGAQMEHMQCLKRVYELFPLGHSFWECFYDGYFQTWKSVRDEKLCHTHRIGPYSFRRFCALAKGKTAVLRSFTLALAFLTNRTEELPRLSAALDRHHIALVLIDDLEDWRQDFERFNFTYPLTRLLQMEGLTQEVSSGSPPSPEQVGRLLYTTGLMEQQIRRAEFFFRKSNEAVGSLPLPLWRDFNKGFEERCRALRHDLAEIRRREEVRSRMRASHHRSNRIADSIRSGIRFLTASHSREDVFRAFRSPHTYMCPSKSLAPSRSITTLIFRSLRSVQEPDPGLMSLLDSTSDWLSKARATPVPPGLPARLERAFDPLPTDPEALSGLDSAFAPGHGPLADGLYWANFLYSCSLQGFRPPKLYTYVLDCIVREDYNPWSFGVSFGPISPVWTKYATRPLLPLLLFCLSLGNRVPREAIQNLLLGPYRTTGSWNNTTETALSLICLLLTEYEGPEIMQAVARLSDSQESDGAWAPNAIYREGKTYYGSKELTTAWCVEALSRYHGSIAHAKGTNR